MVQLGSLVRCQSNSLGVGKVVKVSDNQAQVEYFCSVGDRRVKTLPLSSLSRVSLQSQTRCYFWNDFQDSWTVGRIDKWDDEEIGYQIFLPDSKVMMVTEEEIYVRCNIPITDPIDILAMKGHETPYLHEKRLSLTKCFVEQRAVSRGMTGLLSANIQLLPHQVEVVRRVLSDPVQRYLLADEVGLGKTIESGIIIRQYLLDDPAGNVLVLAPQYLLSQWQFELETKFYISQFGDRLKIMAVEDINQVRLSAEYGLIVIDEAHHLAAMASSGNDTKRRLFDSCKYFAHKSERLLLLSATPVLNNEQDFLTMLHLLDSTTYKLDDIEGFRSRVKNRQEIGRVLLAFNPDANIDVLKDNLTQIYKLFADDEYVLKLTSELKDSLEKDKSKSSRIIRKIRSHISDTYRVHRRMLRNRRDAVEDVIFDRSITPKLEYDIDERAYDIHELLENWRTTAPKKAEYQRIFLILFRAAGTWFGVLRSVIAARLSSKVPTEFIQECGNVDVEALTRPEFFEGEEELLNKLLKILQQPSEDGDRIELLKIVILYRFAEQFQLQSFRSDIKKLQERVKLRIDRPYTGDKLPKIVIFTSFAKTCAEIVKNLQACFGEKAVVSHQSSKQRVVIEKNLNQFKNDSNCFILVCDPSGEEGHNLQFADWIIHFDLPWSPNRLEQRIGRIDRIGRPIKVDFTIFPGVEVDDGPHDAWYRLLKEGFQIFDKSITSLQFYVEEKLPELEASLFASGANGFIEQIAEIQSEMKSEIVKINEQNVLDEIDFQDETASGFWQVLDDYDAKHKEIERAVGGWFLQALRFQESSNPNNQEIKRYQPTTRTLVPADRIKSVFGRSLTYSGTYNRQLANTSKGVHLYRIGEPLIDALVSYVRWDDRGQAFAMWRTEETWNKSEGSEWFGFRFNYIVEANLELAKQILLDAGEEKTKLKSLQRQTDALFPPRIESIFVDARNDELSIVEDEALLNILQRPYFGKKGKEFRDYNLSKGRLAVLHEFVDASKWENFCRNARQDSENLLRNRKEFHNLCQQSAEITQSKLQNRLNQLRLRLEKLQIKQASTSSLAEELKNETRLSSAIFQGIQQPSIKLDSVGFIVVSGRKPLDLGGEDD